MSALIIDQLIERLSSMPDEQQQQVLEFVDQLDKPKTERKGVSGKDLLKFGGLIPLDDLEIMRQVIEEDCGRIDADEW